MNKNYFTNLFIVFFLHKAPVSSFRWAVGSYLLQTAYSLLQTGLYIAFFHFAYGMVNRAGGKSHVSKRWILATG
jgi:ABC-type multidrug transport system permease subunit